jgi:hypothetical protein
MERRGSGIIEGRGREELPAVGEGRGGGEESAAVEEGRGGGDSLAVVEGRRGLGGSRGGEQGRRRAGERGRREGMRGITRLGEFWSINFKKHIEGVSSGVFQRAEKL